MIYLIIGFLLACTWLFVELVTAEVGYEDETGFHYGRGPASLETTAKGNG